MKAATSASESSFDENQAPDWLKAIRAGKSGGESEEEETSSQLDDPALQDVGDDSSMSDLERLLAEEGIDLSSVSERRPDEAHGMSAKEWLISTSNDDLVKKRLDDTPPEAEPSPMPSAPVADSTADEDTMSDLERLLAEEGIDLKAVSEERPDEAHGMSAKDWLLSTSDDDLIRNRIGGEEPIPEPPTPEPSLPETPEAEPAPSPTASTTYEDEDKMVVSDDLPDWLQDIPDEGAATTGAIPAIPEATAEPPADSDTADDLPDWLQNIPDEEPSATETIPAIPEATAEPPADSDTADDLPDWLRDLPDEEPTAADEETIPAAPNLPSEREESDDKMVVADDLPDWLQDVEDDESESSPALSVESTAEDDDLPDWLRDVERESTEEFVKSDLEAVSSLVDAEDTAEDDLPNWLRNAEQDETGEVVLPVETELDDEDLPDWLKRVQAEQETSDTPAQEPPSPSASPPTPTPTPTANGDTEDDLPDWLRESSEAEDDLSTIELARPLSTGDNIPIAEDDLPDWLQEADIDDSDLFEPSEPTPDPFADITTEPDETIDDDIIEDDLPDWLQEVQNDSESDEAESPPIPTATSDDEVVDDQEDLPDWLREVEEGAEPLDVEEPSLTDAISALEATPEAVPTVSDEPVLSTEEISEKISEEPPEEIVAETVETIDQIEEPVEDEAPPAPIPAAETAPTPSPQPTVTPPDMPDWLRKLREGGNDTNSKPQPAAPPPPAMPVRPQPSTLSPQPLPTAPPPPPSPTATVSVAELQPSLPPDPNFDDLPADVDERLRLARLAREDGNINEAVRIYQSLVAANTHLDTVIEQSQQAIKLYPTNAPLYQVMGDAMMRDGRLQSALDAYRQALANLS